VKIRTDIIYPELVAHLLTGGTCKDFAKTHGFAERTVVGWANTEDIRQQIRCLNQKQLDKITQQIHNNIQKAIDKIQEIMLDEDSTKDLQLKACSALLDRYEKYADRDYARQIQELQLKIDGRLGLEDHEVKIRELENKVEELENKLRHA